MGELKINDFNLDQQIDQLIKSGQINLARKILTATPITTIKRDLLSKFGDLARRSQAEYWGLRLMRNVIYPKQINSKPATDQEKTIYAGLLIRVGAYAEASKLLEQTKTNTYQSLLFKSHIAIYQWDYRAAKKYLLDNMMETEMDPYQRAICNLNLASAHIFLQEYKSASRVLHFLLDLALKKNWTLIYGNCLELLAQIAISQNQFSKADEIFEKHFSENTDRNRYSILIEKWKLILQFNKSPELGFKHWQKQVMELQNKALQEKSWEVIRDLDFHLGSFYKSTELLEKVFIGTPYPSYQKRVSSVLDVNWTRQEKFVFQFFNQPSKRIFDLQTGQEINSPVKVKAGQTMHRFFSLLCRDFYKPISLGELFSELFPGEYFNPDTSIQRIGFVVSRLRKWFDQNSIPLQIKVDKKRIGLVAVGPYAVQYVVSKGKHQRSDANEIMIDKLKEKWPYQSFSMKKLCEYLGISGSLGLKLVSAELAENKLYKSGNGRSVLYRFSK